MNQQRSKDEQLQREEFPAARSSSEKLGNDRGRTGGSMADIDSIEKLAAAATPGPWVQGQVSGLCHLKHEHGKRSGPNVCKYDYVIRADEGWDRAFISIPPNVTLIGSDENGPILSEKNAAFIAAARQAVPELCAEVRVEMLIDFLEPGAGEESVCAPRSAAGSRMHHGDSTANGVRLRLVAGGRRR